MVFSMDHSNYNVDYLIIGGGIAGLSAANHFADIHANALLVEAGSLSRFELDHLLAQRAEENGIPILTLKKVLQVSKENQIYKVKLSTGETVTAVHIIVSTGRLSHTGGVQQTAPTFPYYGIKAHFSGVDLKKTLEIYLFPGAYLGVSNIAEDTINLACITRAQELKNTQPLKLL